MSDHESYREPNREPDHESHCEPNRESDHESYYDETILAALYDRAYLYRLLQSLLGSESTVALMDELFSPRAHDALELMMGDGRGTDDVAGGGDLIASLFDVVGKRYSEDPAALVDAARSEYTRLFLGPNALPSPPWESMHVGADRVLLDDVTLEVRRTFAEAGFRPKGYPHVADDHVAIELDFMAILAQRTAADYRDGLVHAFSSYVESQRDFIDKHLGRWVGDFSKPLQQVGDKVIYPQIVAILVRFVAEDRRLLDELENAVSKEA